MAAASIPAVQSPRAAAGDGGAAAANAAVLNSPKSTSRRPGRGGSPWTQVVRAGVEEPVINTVTGTAAPPTPVTHAPAPAPESPRVGTERRTNEESDDSVVEVLGVDNGSTSNAGKKPAWNKPSNGVAEVSPVMGAVSWPALGKSTKASPKASSSDSLPTPSDAALPTLQASGSSTSSSHKQVIPNNSNPTSTPNPVASTRRSMKRGGGSSGGSVNGGSSQLHSPQPQDLAGEIPPNAAAKPTSAAESSPRDLPHKSHGGNEQQQHQRNPFRRGNGGPHPRGDGSYHHNGKRDQDRGHQEWNHRGFGSRDSHLQPQRGFSSRFVRPSTPFIAPPVPGPVRPPFVNPMGYPDMPPHHLIYFQGPPPPDSLRAMPLVSPIPPNGIYFPAPESHLHVPDFQLHAKIVNQIDYYFSNENLVKDLFLRRKMDEEGWVPVKLIAGFKKVLNLTENVENIPLILEAMRGSTVVEVQGDKIRRRNDWMKWIITAPVPLPNVASPQAIGNFSPDMLASSLHSVALDEKALNQGNAENHFGRSSSGEFNLHSGAEGTNQVSTQAGVERPTNA